MKKILASIMLLGIVSCTPYTKEDFLSEEDGHECLSNYYAFVEDEDTEMETIWDLFFNRNTKYRLVKRNYNLPYTSRDRNYNVEVKDIVELERTRNAIVVGVYPICKNWALLNFVRWK